MERLSFLDSGATEDEEVKSVNINPEITVRSRSKYFNDSLRLSRVYYRAFLHFCVKPRNFNKFSANSNDPCIFSTSV